MAGVGTATAGKTLIGTGTTSSPRFASLGTDSGLNQYGLLIGKGNGAIEATAPLTDGQVVIGATGTNPIPASLTAGAGVSITTGPGSISIGLSGGGSSIDSIGTQTGTNPITPDGLGLVTINGAVVAAGTNPVRSDGTGANTLAIEVQTSQATASTDATRIGLCCFDSSSFDVDANGFVSLSSTGAAKTITGDSGGALSPSANNWNILGGPGITTSGSGSTLTINSVVFTDTTATTLAVDNGYFATAAGTYNMPATASQGEIHPACYRPS